MTLKVVEKLSMLVVFESSSLILLAHFSLHAVNEDSESPMRESANPNCHVAPSKRSFESPYNLRGGAVVDAMEEIEELFGARLTLEQQIAVF